MDITAHGQTLATGPSRESVSIGLPTSRETKCAMDAATWSIDANRLGTERYGGKIKGPTPSASLRTGSVARNATKVGHRILFCCERSGAYWLALPTCEKMLPALEPIRRTVPTTMTRTTASMTEYSAMSCRDSSPQRFKQRLRNELPINLSRHSPFPYAITGA